MKIDLNLDKKDPSVEGKTFTVEYVNANDDIDELFFEIKAGDKKFAKRMNNVLYDKQIKKQIQLTDHEKNVVRHLCAGYITKITGVESTEEDGKVIPVSAPEDMEVEELLGELFKLVYANDLAYFLLNEIGKYNNHSIRDTQLELKNSVGSSSDG